MLDIWPVDLEQWSETALYYMWKHLGLRYYVNKCHWMEYNQAQKL